MAACDFPTNYSALIRYVLLPLLTFLVLFHLYRERQKHSWDNPASLMFYANCFAFL